MKKVIVGAVLALFIGTQAGAIDENGCKAHGAPSCTVFLKPVSRIARYVSQGAQAAKFAYQVFHRSKEGRV